MFRAIYSRATVLAILGWPVPAVVFMWVTR